ncbi:hypothetical protein BX600DRAFT_507323 [Xylariales sp. PMI_506]|nr:hypothetical protein BX600DRAFT_507323 [Xylariales sp. PMI_506]
MAGDQSILEPAQSLETTGARAVCTFEVDGTPYLVIPQLAQDIEGQVADMTRGDSDVPVHVYTYRGGQWSIFQQLPSPGGEDAEAFRIGNRQFLAIASLRSGSGATSYEYSTHSNIYEFTSGRFELFQQIPSFAAKQWRFFDISGCRFLALAQGFLLENESTPPENHLSSKIYEWTGSSFEEFQTIDSQWGYNWHQFNIGSAVFLAYADHSRPSVIYRWDGAGGREFALLQKYGRTYVVQVNFISGTRQAPTTALQSFLYELVGDRLIIREAFNTNGGTDVAVINISGTPHLAVSESLAPDASFKTSSHVYKINLPAPQGAQAANSIYQNPEMVTLFHTYTTNPTGIGANLKLAMSQYHSTEPLIVATGTDVALFPGDGSDPSFESFRFSTRGFKEITSVSHLGPAIGSIIKMRELGPETYVWKEDAERLLEATRMARSVNSTALWTEKIQVESYSGREAEISAMIDYGCALSIRFLETILADETKATPRFLQEAFLEGTDGSIGAVVPYNFIMLATFYMASMDITFRLTRWFKRQQIDWSRAQVLICGKQGRPTSGVTWTTSSIAQMILGASNNELSLSRLYIAPLAPSFTITDPTDIHAIRKYEEPMRDLWGYTRAISELATTMFGRYPAYNPEDYEQPVITRDTKSLHEMPKVQDMSDWYSMITRLRIVVEDPRQLLSACLADVAVRELQRTGNDPTKVTVPGLTGIEYPVGLNDKVSSRGSWATDEHTARNSRLINTISPAASSEHSSLDSFTPTYKFLPVSHSGSLAYWTSGATTNTTPTAHPPILWLHGLPLSSVSWYPQYLHFQRLHYPQIFIDLRGYGGSSKLPQPAKFDDYSVTELYVSDVLALLDHLKVSKVALVGFASAGHLALRIAAEHPLIVAKLVVLNGSPKFRASPDWKFGFSQDSIQSIP